MEAPSSFILTPRPDIERVWGDLCFKFEKTEGQESLTVEVYPENIISSLKSWSLVFYCDPMNFKACATIDPTNLSLLEVKEKVSDIVNRYFPAIRNIPEVPYSLFGRYANFDDLIKVLDKAASNQDHPGLTNLNKWYMKKYGDDNKSDT